MWWVDKHHTFFSIDFPLKLTDLAGGDGGTATGRSTSSVWMRDRIRRKRLRPSRALSGVVLTLPVAVFLCQLGLSRVEASIYLNGKRKHPFLMSFQEQYSNVMISKKILPSSFVDSNFLFVSRHPKSDQGYQVFRLPTRRDLECHWNTKWSRKGKIKQPKLDHSFLSVWGKGKIK